MSGGHYDYKYAVIKDLAFDIEVPSRGEAQYTDSALRKKFKKHLELVALACRAIEWNDSGDGDSEEITLLKKCLGGKNGIQTSRH